MTSDHYRWPAEWQAPSAVLLSWPHLDTDWAYMLDEVRQCYVSMARAISQVAHLVIVCPDASAVATDLKGWVERDRYTVLEMPTNDTWARDFGFISTVGSDGHVNLLDYKFNGWGLKFAACYDNLVNRHIVSSDIINADKGRYVNRLGFVLEGGSIDIDEDGVVLTTSQCLLSPNRNGDLDRQQIEDILLADLGATKVIWLQHGALEGDDTDSHVDTLARFLPGRLIAYTSCDRIDDPHYAELGLMADEISGIVDAEGRGYDMVALPIPQPIYDEDGQRLPATYANFLIVNGALFLPVYGDPVYDEIAVSRLKAALPSYRIYTVDCRPLIRQHGSLHCATMQLPSSLFL